MRVALGRRRALFPSHVAGYRIPDLYSSWEDYRRCQLWDVDELKGPGRRREVLRVQAALAVVEPYQLIRMPHPVKWVGLEDWLIERLERLES